MPDQDRPQRTPSAAETFGEDLGEPIFQDLSPEPSRTSTASTMAKEVRKDRALAAHERNLDQLAVTAAHQADERAHEQVMVRISRGQDIPPNLASAAMRHQQRMGGLGLSTAQLHAMNRG